MLVTFRSESYANITMFGDVAVTLLKLMGQSGRVPGALVAEDVPDALGRLRAALASDASLAATGASVDDQEDDSGERPVSLVHRALPLIELLEAAEKAKSYVMWDK